MIMDQGEGPKPPLGDVASEGSRVMLPIDFKRSERRIEVSRNNQDSSGSKDGIHIEGLGKGDQILSPFEGIASIEYPKKNKQADGILSEGKIIVSSKDSAGNSFNLTINAKNIQLSGALDSSTDLTTTEDGIVKSSKGIPIKMGEPIGTFKNQPMELHLNASPGTPAPGSSSSAV
jgi:hypothetical protein